MSFSDKLRLVLHRLLPKRVRYYLLERDMKKLNVELIESRSIERSYEVGINEPVMVFATPTNPEQPKNEELN